jgi:hypothetical protein
MSTTDATVADTGMPTTTGEDLALLADRVDRALAEVAALEPAARAKAVAVRLAIEEFHKAGLTRIVRRLKEDPRGRDLLFELVDEPAVHALFAMHGLPSCSRTAAMCRSWMSAMGRPS